MLKKVKLACVKYLVNIHSKPRSHSITKVTTSITIIFEYNNFIYYE